MNFQDVMTSELKNLGVNVQNLEVIQEAYKKTRAKNNIMQKYIISTSAYVTSARQT